MLVSSTAVVQFKGHLPPRSHRLQLSTVPSDPSISSGRHIKKEVAIAETWASSTVPAIGKTSRMESRRARSILGHRHRVGLVHRGLMRRTKKVHRLSLRVLLRPVRRSKVSGGQGGLGKVYRVLLSQVPVRRTLRSPLGRPKTHRRRVLRSLRPLVSAPWPSSPEANSDFVPQVPLLLVLLLQPRRSRETQIRSP